eukprot:14124071-Alexandrium_andersonii.AAC.1
MTRPLPLTQREQPPQRRCSCARPRAAAAAAQGCSTRSAAPKHWLATVGAASTCGRRQRLDSRAGRRAQGRVSQAGRARRERAAQ